MSKKRERKVNIDNLLPAQADNISKTIGQELAKIMDEANNKCNELLNIYNLETKISYNIQKIEEEKAQ